MGETGCGKTRLIRFMCRLKAGRSDLQNMVLVKVRARDLLTLRNSRLCTNARHAIIEKGGALFSMCLTTERAPH